MKFSIRPEPCVIPYTEDHYVISDRLSMHQIDKPVVYATGFSRSGWGKRLLTEVELAQAFDLPSYVPWNAVFPLALIPIQILRVVVDSVLESVRPAVQERACARLRPAVEVTIDSAPALPIDAEWLTSLGKWLPGSWANVVIADKAVKADSAAVQRFPWNQRIVLALSSAAGASIQGMEQIGLKWWQSRIIRSFLVYLRTTYGIHWRQYVRSYHHNLRRGGGGHGEKRSLRDSQQGDAHEWGGWGTIRGQRTAVGPGC